MLSDKKQIYKESDFSLIIDYPKNLIRLMGNVESITPTAIINGVRLSSELGFPIEEETRISILNNKDKLKGLSAEDTYGSLKGIFLGKDSLKVINEYREEIAVLIPEIKEMFYYEQFTPGNFLYLWTHSLIVMNNAKSNNHPFEFKVAGLFHDIGITEDLKMSEHTKQSNCFNHAERSAKMTEEILSRLKFPREEIAKIAELIRDHGLEIEEDPYEIKKNISKMGIERFMDMIDFKIADKYDKTTYKILGDKRVDKLKRIRKIAESHIK